MRRDVEAIAGGKQSRLTLILKTQSRGTCEQQHPFAFVLVVPEAWRARLPAGDSALDANAGTVQQRFVDLVGARVRERSEQVHGFGARSSSVRSQFAKIAAASYV